MCCLEGCPVRQDVVPGFFLFATADQVDHEIEQTKRSHDVCDRLCPDGIVNFHHGSPVQIFGTRKHTRTDYTGSLNSNPTLSPSAPTPGSITVAIT